MTSEAASTGSRGLSVPARRAAIVVALLICLAIDGCLAWEVRDQVSLGATDFIAFYTAGQLVSHGNGVHLFVGPPTKEIVAYPNAHPAEFTHVPYEALLFVPFAHLSYAAATWLWCILCILLANISVFVMVAELPAVAGRLELAILAVGLFMPVLIAEFNGQDSLVTLLLFSLCFKCLMRDRVALAGTALACASFKPPLVIAMFLLIATTNRKRWRFIGGFAVTGCILFILSIAAVSWQGVVGYPAFLRRYAATGDLYHASDMPNLRGLIVGLMPENAFQSVTKLLVLLLSLSALIVAIWLCRRYGDEAKPLHFALYVTTTILVGFHEYAYDLVLLVLPILIIWNWFSAQPRDQRRYVWVPAAIAILVLGSATASLKPRIFTWAVVLVFVFLCVLLWTESPERGGAAVQSAA